MLVRLFPWVALTFALAALVVSSGALAEWQVMALIEPRVNMLRGDHVGVPLGKWIYLFHVRNRALDEEGPRLPELRLLGFTPSGELTLLQEMSERKFEETGIEFVLAHLTDGRVCRIASNYKIPMGDRIYMAGGDALKEMLSTDPQLFDPLRAVAKQIRFFNLRDRRVMYRTVGYPKLHFWIERSIDSGKSWVRIGGTFPSISEEVSRMEVAYLHPTDPARFFARVDFKIAGKFIPDSQIAETRDYGESFNLIGSTEVFRLLQISEADPRVRYQVTSAHELYRSDDDSEHLNTRISPAVRDPICFGRLNVVQFSVSGLAIDPNDSNTALLATSQGLMRTSDGGRSWKIVNMGIASAETVEDVLFDPSLKKTVYVGTRKGLLVSQDNGYQWRRINIEDCVGKDQLMQLVPIDPDAK